MVAGNAKSFSIRCVTWQWDQLMRMPLEGVNASPLESNVFEWHGNFYFPDNHEHFPNMVVHFILELPSDYPNSPPDMRLLNPFPHSHVHGDTICFSLLKHWLWWFQGQGLPGTTFWNPSRSIRSLLESVYIFLTVDEDGEVVIDSSLAKTTLARSRTATCCACGHAPSKGTIWPLEQDWLAARTPQTSATSQLEQQICALAMHEDVTSFDNTKKPRVKPAMLPKKAVTVEINEKTGTVPQVPCKDMETQLAIRKVGAAAALARDNARLRREDVRTLTFSQCESLLLRESMEDFCCSVTGVSFNQARNVIMGFGVNVIQRTTDGSIESITTDLMPISLQVFQKGTIRMSALGATITHFFPFAINDQHYEKASKVLPGCVDAILAGSKDGRTMSSDDEKLLFVVGELWKSMAVLMMKGEAHASEKVLKGFCCLHHLLLCATDEIYPSGGPFGLIDNVLLKQEHEEVEGAAKDSEWEVVSHRQRKRCDKTSGLLAVAQKRVDIFVRHTKGRHKSKCPDFGRFLPLILLSNLDWGQIKQPFVEELLTRNARWIVKVHKNLGDVKPNEERSPTSRAERSWEPSNTGLKLTAFQIRFALNVIPWARQALSASAMKVYENHGSGGHRLLVRDMYNSLGGRPTPQMLSRFQEEAKAIEAMQSFIEMPSSDMKVQEMLCEAMRRSKQYRYHW